MPTLLDPRLADLPFLRIAGKRLLHKNALRQTPQARTALFRPLPDDPEAWLRTTFLRVFQNAQGQPVPFAPHHTAFWDWFWALRPGDAARTFIALWGRGGGKSSSIELGAAVCGIFGLRRYILYVCHEVGTRMYDPSLGAWMNVEDHPTATRVVRDGLEITLTGLPWIPEVVTPEHRYWARRIARRDRGHGKGTDIMFGRPRWIEAQDLDWNTWIGYPIDDVEEPAVPVLQQWNRSTRTHEPWECPFFANPEWYWVFGLWWGDGTLGGQGGIQIAFSCATAHPHIRQRLIDCLTDAHIAWKESFPASGAQCSSIYFCHAALARWLQTWRVGRNRKEPPAWVEHAPKVFQAALLRGYCDADGSRSDRWVSLTSIHLPGLLMVRRMLMRLGIPSQLSHRKRQRDFSYQGRIYAVQPSYMLRFAEGAAALGYDLDRHNEDVVRDLFCADGFLWSRVKEIDLVHDRTFVPLQTATQTYLTHFGLSHNCAGQQQADDHVSNVASLLEQAGIDRALNRYGFSRGWRVNRLRTADGCTVDAVGLDTAARGVRIDADRPDLILLDDLDNEHDTPLTTEKKIMTLTRAILPTGSAALAVAGVQNIPNVDGIFAQLADGRAEFLVDRELSGPHPVLADLPDTDWWVQESGPEGMPRIRLLQGRPTWAGQGIADCEALITKIGIRAFQIECQHLTSRLTGTMFQREWFPIVEDWPRNATRVRWWDFAGTEEKRNSAGMVLTDPDFSVGLLVAYLNGQYWILDMQRVRLTPKGVEDLVAQTAMLDGRAVAIWIGEEPGSSGKAVVEDYQRRVLVGYSVHGKRETGSKADRAKPASSAAEAKNIFLVEGGWNATFLDTHGDVMLFPYGAHDDIVDCLSGAVNVLHKPSGGGAISLRGY